MHEPGVVARHHLPLAVSLAPFDDWFRISAASHGNSKGSSKGTEGQPFKRLEGNSRRAVGAHPHNSKIDRLTQLQKGKG
jgi:hypothetical protein